MILVTQSCKFSMILLFVFIHSCFDFSCWLKNLLDFKENNPFQVLRHVLTFLFNKLNELFVYSIKAYCCWQVGCKLQSWHLVLSSINSFQGLDRITLPCGTPLISILIWSWMNSTHFEICLAVNLGINILENVFEYTYIKSIRTK